MTGSRLPLPPTFLLLEISYPDHKHTSNRKVPGTSSLGRLEVIQEEEKSQEQQTEASQAVERHPGAFAVACALLLLLGWEETGQTMCSAPSSGKSYISVSCCAPVWLIKVSKSSPVPVIAA